MLPKHRNLEYIDISEGSYFGIIDIVGGMAKINHLEDMENWLSYKESLKRQFTVMSSTQCELLMLNLTDLNRMRMEFVEAYESLYDCAYARLDRALNIKVKAIKYANNWMDTTDFPDKYARNMANADKTKKYQNFEMFFRAYDEFENDDPEFEPIPLDEVDDMSSLFSSSDEESSSK